MDKKLINKKMKVVKDFFNLDSECLQDMLGRNIPDSYDFSEMNITDIIILAKELKLSLEILEYVFCNPNTDLKVLKKIINLYRTNGIVRRIDNLGRIVLPSEQREWIHLLEGDPVEISLDFLGNFIVKPTNKCISCGRTNKITQVNGIYLCKYCLKKHKELNEKK